MAYRVPVLDPRIIMFDVPGDRDKTIVWHVNGYMPVPRGWKVELTAHRRLVHSVPQEEETSISDPIVGAVSRRIVKFTEVGKL